MAKHCPANERIKRQYLSYLKEAGGKAESTIDQSLAAIALFEESTNYRDFKKFHIEQARKFKLQLQKHVNPDTGRGLSLATIHSRQMALKAFFKWLAGQPGYKSRIGYADADYFNTAGNDERVAKAEHPKETADLEQIERVLATMPTSTLFERRDRAVIAFTLLSGARDDAIASLRLRHVDLAKRTVFQDARTVRTKRRKSFTSTFFPVGDHVEAIVREWIEELRLNHLYGPDDPLFPKTKMGLDANGYFAPLGLAREPWCNATPIRKIFRQAFECAGLRYYNPHSLRNTLVTLGERICRTPEEFKAWSQNLGHEKVLTTFTGYGDVTQDRQAEIIRGLKANDGRTGSSEAVPDPGTISRVLDFLRDQAR